MAGRKTMLKGVNDIKTVHTIRKSAAQQNSGNDFLRLYMLEMERTRLVSEKNKLIQRIEVIEARLEAIREVCSESLAEYERVRACFDNIPANEEPVPGFRTMSIDY